MISQFHFKPSSLLFPIMSYAKLLSIGLTIAFTFLFATVLIGKMNFPIIQGWIQGFLLALLFFVFLSPLFFVAQTERPSTFQRFCRSYSFAVLCLLTRGDIFTQQDISRYRYWLSHPKTLYNPPLIAMIDQTNTSSFDWNIPSAWPF